MSDGVDGAMIATVIAVILTYNRKDLLKKSLQAIARQTRAPDAIVVINNASTDGTGDMLSTEFPQVTHVRMPENGGAAWGFYEAMKYAQISGHTWLWIMDDEGEPAPEALAHLLDGATKGGWDFVTPLILDISSPDKLAYPLKLDNRWCVDAGRVRHLTVIEGQAHLFMANLMRTRLIAEFGLPDTRFYHPGVEIEYVLRLVRHHVKQAVLPKALYYHPANRGNLVLPARFFWARARVTYTDKDWKNYFLYRNIAYINRYVKDQRAGLISLTANFFLYAIFFLVMRRGDIRGYALCMRAVFDGLRGKFEDPKQILARYP